MDIEFHGRGVFLVSSHGETFTVDTLFYERNGQWNGSCDCWHFKRNLKPAIEDAIADKSFLPGRRFRCPHIEEAREKLLDMFLCDLAKKYPDHKQPT